LVHTKPFGSVLVPGLAMGRRDQFCTVWRPSCTCWGFGIVYLYEWPLRLYWLAYWYLAFL